MCNQSSSADPFGAALERYAGPPGHSPDRCREEMIRGAYIVGPATALFITDLWDRATQYAHWESLFIMQLSRWYSCRRVERAAHRLLNRGASGRLDLLRRVLEEELDFLDERCDADLDGQLVFPFDRPMGIEDYEQSGN